MQLLSAGAERWRGAIADALCALQGIQRVWERSDADVRELEGLKPRTGLVRGTPLPAPAVVHEQGLSFKVEIDAGHKTGFYLDQRDNRLLLRKLAADKDVLDCFSYTGGFAINALRGGARSVLAIDSSSLALDMAKANAQLNALPPAEWLNADVFQSLRRLRDQGRAFDLIVLDPPKFAPTAAHAERICRPVSENRGGRSARCECRRAHRSVAARCCGPSGSAQLPGKRILERPALPRDRIVHSAARRISGGVARRGATRCSEAAGVDLTERRKAH
jgi:hypothetical protein